MISILITEDARLSESLKISAIKMGYRAFETCHRRGGRQLCSVAVQCDETQFAQIQARTEKVMRDIDAGRTTERY
jgi:hypothetical protein